LHDGGHSWRQLIKTGMGSTIGAAGGVIMLAAAAAAAPKVLAYTCVSPEAAKVVLSGAMMIRVSKPISPASESYGELTPLQSLGKPVETINKITNQQNAPAATWCTII